MAGKAALTDKDLADLVASDFQPYKGDTLEMVDEAGNSLAVELLEVTEHPSEYSDGSRKAPFSLCFRADGAAKTELTQGTHTFRHKTMGEVTLFVCRVVPRTEDEACAEFQTHFN